MPVVRRLQLLQMTSPPKLLAGFSPNLTGMILIWPSLIIVLMFLVRCISRSHRLDQKLSLDISYVANPSGPLPSLFKLCTLCQKWPGPGCHMFFIGLFRENEKIFMSDSTRPRALIFGM